MIEIKFSGANAEEVTTKMRSMLEMLSGGKAATGKAATGKTDESEKPKLTEDDVRNAWAKQKEKGFDVSHLKSVLGKFEGVTKIGELKAEQYATAIKHLNALKKEEE